MSRLRCVSIAFVVAIAAALGGASVAAAGEPEALSAASVDTSVSLNTPPVVVGGELYFDAADAEHGTELWRSNGTSGGTEMVADIQVGTGSSNPAALTNVNGTLYFSADDGVHGAELWRSDGTPGGTTMVEDIRTVPSPSVGSGPSELANVGGTLFFMANDGEHGQELWRSDAEGTTMVKDIHEGALSSEPRELSSLDGTLVFRADDGVHGAELWTSNGEAAGTKMLVDINPEGASFPSWRVPPVVTRRLFSAPLYFAATDPEHGRELWRTDGTASGTEFVTDIDPGTESSNPLGFVRFGGTTYFAAAQTLGDIEPWGANETETFKLKEINPTGPSTPLGREVSNGVAFFTANDGEHGQELWRSTGTEASTRMVKDINPSGPAFVGLFPELTDVNGTLFFSADDGAHGTELWQSNGHEEDTQMTADLNSTGASTPRMLTSVGGRLFFFADGGSGERLWTLSTGLGDADEDGIADAIDLEPGNPSRAFSDGAAPTEGEVVEPGDVTLTISDAADADGVRIAAGPGSEGATLSMCGGFTLVVEPQTEVLATCGSLTVQVIEGAAQMSVAGGTIVVTVPAGGKAKVKDNGEGGFDVENLGPGDVTVTVDGQDQTVGSGETTTVEAPPADLPPTAVGDETSVDKDSGPNPIDVLANDANEDGGPIEVIAVGGAAHGSVAIAPGGGAVTYEPDDHYCGADLFTYTLNGGSSATVSVEVRCGHHHGHHHGHGHQCHGHGHGQGHRHHCGDGRDRGRGHGGGPKPDRGGPRSGH